MREPIIIPPPTDAEIRAKVDCLITPENADAQVAALRDLMFIPSDPEDPVKGDIIETALRYAFTKTSSFEDAYRAFRGVPGFAHNMEVDQESSFAN
jgi:hypothetical protein